MRCRPIGFLFLLCLIYSGLSGQVSFKGKINEPTDTMVTLLIPPIRLGGETTKVSTRLSANNEFHFEIRTHIATSAQVAHGEILIPLFIIPDQPFSMEFTVGDQGVNDLLFAGAGGPDNTFFLRYHQFITVEAPPIDSNRLAKSTARQYRRLMDENRAARANFIATYTQKAKPEVAPQLLQWLQSDIAYTYATDLLRYPSVFEDMYEGARSRSPSANYYAFLEGIRLNNPDAILQRSYQQFLESFIIHKLERPMSWELRTGGAQEYAFLSRFLFGPSLHYMQYLIFERTLNWLVEPDYMAQEYQTFMVSKAPDLLKQKLKKRRENPPKIYSIKSFSIVGGPLLWEVFQQYDSSRLHTSFSEGRPSLLYFYDRRLTRTDFVIRYLKKVKQNLSSRRDMNICLVDVNGNFDEWQSIYANNDYADDPITHLSMNYFDELFDTSIEQGIYPNMLMADANGIILKTLDWKPPVKRLIEIIDRLP